MEKKRPATLTALAMALIAGLEIVALYLGHDGNTLLLAMTGIAGLAGWNARGAAKS